MMNILKRLQKPLIKSYEQFNFSSYGNLRAVFAAEKGSKNFLPEKASQPLRNFATFPKKCNQETMILVAKTQNIYKAQKRSQKASRSLSSRVMSN